MISGADFYEHLRSAGVEFFAGVPDSLLKNFCGYVQDTAPRANHLIAANEGAAVALAVGHHVATGNVPLVYLQNSGLGNMVNPLVSAVDARVFAVPMLLLIGWRGEPGVTDEPQHQAQGEITPALLDVLRIPHHEVTADAADPRTLVERAVAEARGRSGAVALLVRKNTFEKYEPKSVVRSEYPKREDVLRELLAKIPKDAAIFSTTGKLSREVFELRHPDAGDSFRDFLTVGSMGHVHAIALGAAIGAPHQDVFCLDGDGSMLMHLGTLAVAGALDCPNLRYLLFNNGAHESVGGQATVGFDIDIPGLARACGFQWVESVDSLAAVAPAVGRLLDTRERGFLEFKISIGSRGDLGRPTVKPRQVKANLMEFFRARRTDSRA